MDTLTIEKRISGIKLGFTAEKRLLQKERDSMIISLVNSYQTVTCELVTALLGMERTSSNLSLVDRRLKILAGQKYFTQIHQQNVTYTVAFAVGLRRKGERAQLIHRTMHSRFFGTLLRAGEVDEWKADREFRTKEGQIANGRVVPDGHFRIGQKHYFLECNTGFDSFDHPLKKQAEYVKLLPYLQDLFGDSIRVLWVNRLPSRTEDMLRRFQGGLALVVNELEFTPFRPQSIFEPIWRSPKDKDEKEEKRCSLLED